MRRITLTKLTIEGFGSFQERTEITFNDSPGLKYLAGANLYEPRLGSNGAGKSSLWEALFFCLYGTSSAGDRAAALKARDSRQIAVEAELQVANAQRVVKRLAPPNKAYLDDEPVEQEKLDELLGLNRQRAVQAIMHGQRAPLFLDLSVPARGELLESVLSLELWSSLADRAGREAAKAEKAYQSEQQALAFQEGKLASLPDLAALAEKSRAWRARRREEIETALEIAEHAGRELDEARSRLSNDLSDEAAPAPDDRALREVLGEMAVAQAKDREFEALAKFLDTHDACPTCGQRLTSSLKHRGFMRCDDGQAEQRKLLKALREKQRGLDEEYKLAHARRERWLQQREEQRHLQQQVKTLERSVVDLCDRAEQLAVEENPYAQQREEVIAQRKRILEDRKLAKKMVAEWKTRLDYMQYWKGAFRRVRFFVIKRVLARLELEVSNAASLLGIDDWRIQLVTETETKSGSLRPGIQVLVTPPGAKQPADLYSGGEMQRVKLALNFGISRMIQSMAAVDYGFEVWDEPSAGLSDEGIEDLLSALAAHAQQSDKAVWLLDHRQLASSGAFTEVYWVIKEATGSRVSLRRPAEFA